MYRCGHLRVHRLSDVRIERCKREDVKKNLQLRNSIQINPFNGVMYYWFFRPKGFFTNLFRPSVTFELK